MNIFLQFSDGAKFADVARNIIEGFGYGNNFTFYGSTVFNNLQKAIFPAPGILPVMPYSIAMFFKILGVTDFAVIATSSFYFLLTLLFVFLLAKKVFNSNLVGFLSTLVVGFNNDLINYAVSGASEAPFIFEIVAASYFISLKKKWTNFIALVVLVLMYFTRSQSFIYIAGFVLYWLLLNIKTKKAILIFSFVVILGLLIDRFVLYGFSGKYFLYSVTARGIGAATSIVSGGSASDSLRGNLIVVSGTVTLVKKIFYNLYNFYKLLPQIINPYLFALFIIGLIKWSKGGIRNSFKIVSIFMIVVTFLVAATSIPFFRYLHPVIPFVYIIAVGTLVELISNFKFPISKQLLVIFISVFVTLFFGVGQTLGIIFLDSRFTRNSHNIDKPPVYVVLSRILKENTQSKDVVITNLDTWGSWYGERRTVWFPVEPKQLINPKNDTIPFDVIYLTDYLIDDQNYYMGNSWREIFNNPNNPEKWTCGSCTKIAKQFKLKGVYSVADEDDYERRDAKAILLVRK